MSTFQLKYLKRVWQLKAKSPRLLCKYIYYRQNDTSKFTFTILNTDGIEYSEL